MNYFLKRALAYWIDCIIAFGAVMLILQWAILSPLRGAMGITDEWLMSSLNMQLYVVMTISIPVWAYFTLLDSRASKGTPGKRILKLSVRGAGNKPISMGRSLLRTAAKLAPWEIAHFGIIWPEPIYFQEEPGIPIMAIIGLILLGLYVVSVLVDRENRTIYDRLLRTAVQDKKVAG